MSRPLGRHTKAHNKLFEHVHKGTITLNVITTSRNKTFKYDKKYTTNFVNAVKTKAEDNLSTRLIAYFHGLPPIEL